MYNPQYNKQYKQLHKKEIEDYNQKYYQAHKKEASIRHQEYYKIHKKEILLYNQNWQKEHPDSVKIRAKIYREKNKMNPQFRINESMAATTRHCLRGQKRWRRWKNLVGYTIKDLLKHLESLFDNKMNWDNYGSYWVIDHIKPKSLFYYKTAEDSEFKRCWALNNLQPLEKITNLKKSNHYEYIK